MPDKKISELPVRSVVLSTDLLPNAADDTTWGSPISAVSNLVRDDIGIETLQTTEPDGFANIAVGYPVAIPSTRMLVRQDEVGGEPSAINVTAQFQQFIRDPDRLPTAQPICLRGYQQIDAGVAVASSFAISGELHSHTDEGGTLGLCATSGVAMKYGRAPIFAMHGVATDNINNTADPTLVTSIVGAEFGSRAIGLDHPTTNFGYGSRRTVQIVPRSHPDIDPTPGETGVGLDIRTQSDAAGGYYRYALVIREHPSNPNPIGTALEIDTSGTNGIVITGTQTTAFDLHSSGLGGPTIKLGSQGSANGAINANLDWTGHSSTGNRRSYTRDRSVLVDNTDGAENGRRDFLTMQAGTMTLEGFFAGGLALGGAAGGVQGPGSINVPAIGYFVGGTKVVGAQGAAVANATDAASVITQLNLLLARCRAHGLIAT